jgi:anaerobic sulfite reductase subunit C
MSGSPHQGIIREVTGKGKITIRATSALPVKSEFTGKQIKALEEIAEKYGSRRVHVTPRQSIEIPDVCRTHLEEVTKKLQEADFTPGSTGNTVRNVFTCSRWCLYNGLPIGELSERLSSDFSNKETPGKVTLSLSACSFSCSRSMTSDIGIIGKVKIKISREKCIQCKVCIRDPLGCQVDAIEIPEDGVKVDSSVCVNCGFCSNVCKPGAITVRSLGYEIIIGGSGGVMPRIGTTYEDFVDGDSVPGVVGRIIERYRALGEEGERIGDVLDRIGMEVFKNER